MKETDVAEHVVSWLCAEGWEVYQEVEPQQARYGIADIVAVSGPLTWIVECKNSVSLALLSQAVAWKGYANFISIATPWKRQVKGHRAAKMFLGYHGIGHLVVLEHGAGWEVRSEPPPSLARRISPVVKNSLNDHQKTYAQAGNAEGRRWTPFQQTCLELLRVVRGDPGIHMRAAMDRVNHHYSSDSTARSTISRYLQAGNIVKGVTARRDGRFLRLYAE